MHWDQDTLELASFEELTIDSGSAVDPGPNLSDDVGHQNQPLPMDGVSLTGPPDWTLFPTSENDVGQFEQLEILVTPDARPGKWLDVALTWRTTDSATKTDRWLAWDLDDLTLRQKLAVANAEVENVQITVQAPPRARLGSFLVLFAKIHDVKALLARIGAIAKLHVYFNLVPAATVSMHGSQRHRNTTRPTFWESSLQCNYRCFPTGIHHEDDIGYDSSKDEVLLEKENEKWNTSSDGSNPFGFVGLSYIEYLLLPFGDPSLGGIRSASFHVSPLPRASFTQLHTMTVMDIPNSSFGRGRRDEFRETCNDQHALLPVSWKRVQLGGAHDIVGVVKNAMYKDNEKWGTTLPAISTVLGTEFERQRALRNYTKESWERDQRRVHIWDIFVHMRDNFVREMCEHFEIILCSPSPVGRRGGPTDMLRLHWLRSWSSSNPDNFFAAENPRREYPHPWECCKITHRDDMRNVSSTMAFLQHPVVNEDARRLLESCPHLSVVVKPVVTFEDMPQTREAENVIWATAYPRGIRWSPMFEFYRDSGPRAPNEREKSSHWKCYLCCRNSWTFIRICVSGWEEMDLHEI